MDRKEPQVSWHGKQGRGAMCTLREEKRREAEQRNAEAKPERRKAYRLGPLDINGRRTAKSISRYQAEMP